MAYSKKQQINRQNLLFNANSISDCERNRKKKMNSLQTFLREATGIKGKKKLLSVKAERSF
jgi:hypothetical protein